MQSAAQAYGNVARQIASPRELEADLLLKAASRLQAVHDGWDASTGQLDEALLLQPQALVDLPDLGDQRRQSAAGGRPPERRQSRHVRDEPDDVDDERSAAANSSAR